MEETKPPQQGPFETPPSQPAEPSEPPALPELDFPVFKKSPAAPRVPSVLRLEDWLAVLHNRLILGGLGVIVVLLLTAVVLVVIGNDPEPTRRSAVPAADVTPDGDADMVSPGGLIGRVRTTVTLRNGPDTSYAILGTIPRGTRLVLVGRNEDERWLQVRYPPGSNLRGWVDARFIDVEGDASRLAIAGPGPRPDVPVPTGPAPVTEEPLPTFEPEEPTATRVRRATRTPPRLTPTRTAQATATPVSSPQPPPTPTPPPQPTGTPTG